MRGALWLAAALLVLVPAAAAQPMYQPGDEVTDTVNDAVQDVESPVAPEQFDAVKEFVAPTDDEPAKEEPAKPPRKADPGFADRVATAFEEETMAWGLGSAAAVVLSLGGFVMVTRYISPKEALRNPQRSMLYGYIRGNPGAHLKQLSEEFAMKTSSILWHIRKLESAELVNSERVGGYRVFYAVEGGIEIKRVSRAITALQNDNARRIFERVKTRPGQTTRQVAEGLTMHGGTARWHLRRLRESGLLDELAQEAGSSFFCTPLGTRALETMEGSPVEATPRRSPLPTSE